MRLTPRSLFGRNVLLITALIAIGQLTTALVFLQAVQRPRLEELANLTAAQVRALGVSLAVLPEVARARYVAELNALDSVDIEAGTRPATGRRAPLPVRRFMRLLAQRLGSDGDVIWQPRPRPVIWVRVPVAGQSYWVQLSSERLRPRFSGTWLGMSVVFGVLALAGAYAIQRRLNRPLRELAAAAEQVGAGALPPPLAENVPTEIAAVSRSFNTMARNLARINAERAVMLAGISHDLRTPLTKLRLRVAMLGGSEQDNADMIRHIEEMDATIGQFMDFARIDGDEPTAAVDLNELVRSLAESFAAQGQPFALELAALPPLRLRPVAMRRLLSNLMHNAAAYAGTGLAVRTRRLADNRVELSVLDRGPGVPAAQLEHLKQPFTRMNEARTGKPGAGLGLAIVERIAHLHGGEFTLRLREGGGLEAGVALPLH